MSAVEALLKIEALNAGYGPTQVLHDVNFSLHAGEALAVIGANGAGKTTLMRAITGLLPLQSGAKYFKGTAITETPAHQLPHQGLVLVPEGRRVFPRLSVSENLDLGATALRERGRQQSLREHIFSLFPILAERRSQAAGTLSGGEQQMLAIGRALMSAPTLLLLDEPSLGVAPKLVERIFEALHSLRAEGLSMLLIEQNAQIALSFAERALVLENGRCTITGPARELLQDARVREAYLKA
jgi:branched-chain amino acid transport system ATP-binding protein